MLMQVDDRETLARYVTSASTQGQIYFNEHQDARPGNERRKIAKKANTLIARKVVVDILGRIRNAND